MTDVSGAVSHCVARTVAGSYIVLGVVDNMCIHGVARWKKVSCVRERRIRAIQVALETFQNEGTERL
jgi:hypothetical protein